MRVTRLNFVPVLSLLMTLVLTACGGGGGSSGGDQGGGDSGGGDSNAAPVITNVVVADNNGGDPVVGDTLSVSYDYSDPDGDPEGASGVQWFRGDQAIAGASNASYQIAVADVDADISVEVTPVATAGEGPGATVRSDSLTVVNSAPVINDLTVEDTNGDSLVVGDTLNVSYQYSDPDGDPEGATSLQWLRGDQPIDGATDNSYQVIVADVDQAISVEVTPVATSGASPGLAVRSDSVTVGNAPPAVTNLTVTDGNGGDLIIGDSLSMSYQYNDLEDDPEGETSLQWFRDDQPIDGATNASYQIVVADADAAISVEITPVATSGTSPGLAVRSQSVTVANSPPEINNLSTDDNNGGNLLVGDTLSASYDYSDTENDPEGESGFQWFRDDQAIAGATNDSYQIVVADADTDIRVEVTPVATSGASPGTAVRSDSMTVINTAPVITNLSVVDNNGGPVFEGEVLSAAYDYSDLENDPEGTSTYQWLRNGVAIADATNATYRSGAADTGQVIAVEVTPIAQTGVAAGIPVVSPEVEVLGDAEPPSLTIDFPPSDAAAVRDTVIVRGTASDNAAVDSVTVNGVAAESDDNFATWTATVPLNEGSNTITATASDAIGNTSPTAGPVTIEIGEFFGQSVWWGQTLQYDANNDFLLMLNQQGGWLAATNPTTDFYTRLSTPTVPDSLNPFLRPSGIALDADNNRGFVVDEFSNGNRDYVDTIIEVDLFSGSRTILSQDALPDPEHALLEPRALQFDSENNDFYILDAPTYKPGNILRYDLDQATGEVLSTSGYRTTGIALDLPHNRLLYSDTSWGIVAVDLTTGEKTNFSTGDIPDSVNPPGNYHAITIDAGNNRALVVDEANDTVVEVDLVSGARTVLVNDISAVELPFSTNNAVDIAFDANANQLLLVHESSHAVYSIALNTGSVVVLSDNSTPDTNNPIYRPSSISIDADNNRALVTSVSNRSIIAVDLTTGARTVVSSDTVPDANNSLERPLGIVADSDNSRALLVDEYKQALLSVDYTNGQRTIVHDNAVPDADNTFMTLSAIAHDVGNNRLLLLDRERQALIAMDLATLNRTIISDRRIPNNVNEFSRPIDIALQGGRALILDSGANAIFSVNLSTGERSVLSSDSIPNRSNRLYRPQQMVLDEARSRLLVILNSGSALAVDLVSGERTALSENNGDPNFSIWNSFDITIDALSDQALVSDRASGRIFAINLVSGERSFYAGGVPWRSNVPLHAPSSLAADVIDNRLLLINRPEFLEPEQVISVNLNTNERTLISGSGVPDSQNNFSSPNDIVFDRDNDRALVLESTRIINVNLSTGARTVLATSPIGSLGSIALDSVNDRVFLAGYNAAAVYEVNLATGDSTLLSDNTTPNANNPFSQPSDIVLDQPNNRLLVADRGNSSLIAVSLSDGSRTVLSNNTIPNNDNPFWRPERIILDAANDRVLVHDGVSGIISVDVASGQRTLLTDSVSGLGSGDIALSTEVGQIYYSTRVGLFKLDLLTGESVLVAR